MSPCYLPYLNAFLSIVVPIKKATKKAAKQLTLITLILLAVPLAGSTRSINNTRAHLYTTSITPKASAINKHRKPSTLHQPPKPGQRTKLTKVTQIAYIEPPVDYSQHIQFQNKGIKEVEEAILYQALEGYSRRRHYYNKTKEVKVRKERKRDKLYTKQERNIKRLKGLNLKLQTIQLSRNSNYTT